MTRLELLNAAAETVVKDRESDYGPPQDSFGRIAALWSAYLEIPLKPADVAAMMILLKSARIRSGHAKEDNWLDIAGYAACGCEIESGGEW